MLLEFLNQYRAKTTRAMYMSAWVKFLSLLYGARLKGASAEILEPWVAKYVNDLRNGRRDLAADLEALGESCRAPKTCLGYQSAIRTLLAREKISLPRRGEGEVRPARRQPRPLRREEPLTPEKILKLMEHLDIRGRAILYILASSGARIGEVLSIRLMDLDLDSRPARFRIRDAEGGVSRVAFLSREAVGAIRVYLIVRERFLASARSRGGSGDPSLLFPLGTRAFGQVWALAVKKAMQEGYDRATGRRNLTPRATRLFFAERMRTLLPDPMVAGLMGRGGRIPESRRGYTDEELGRAYLKGERAILLHGGRRGPEKFAGKLAELERLVGLLQEKAVERDRELARIRRILPGTGENPPPDPEEPRNPEG
jgi:integrase